MANIITILSSVMFVGGLVIASRQLNPKIQLVIGITMMVLATVITFVK